MRLQSIILITTILFTNHTLGSNVAETYRTIADSVVVIKTTNSSEYEPSTSNKQGTNGVGTGFIVSKTGDILTASHVVQTADSVMVELRDGRSYAAKVVSSVVYADLALIRLFSPPKDLKVATLGNSDAIQLGEQLLVVGTPFGKEQSLSVGYLSAKRTKNTPSARGNIELLQTDAAINRGNSGGPVFSLDGKVVGVVSSIISTSGGNQGVGFAIGINNAKDLILNRPPFWSGISYIPIGGEFSKAINAPVDYGLFVQQVAKGSIGHRLGLKGGSLEINYENFPILLGGDVIVKFNQVNIEPTSISTTALFKAITSLKSGEQIKVTVLRNGEFVELTTTL